MHVDVAPFHYLLVVLLYDRIYYFISLICFSRTARVISARAFARGICVSGYIPVFNGLFCDARSPSRPFGARATSLRVSAVVYFRMRNRVRHCSRVRDEGVCARGGGRVLFVYLGCAETCCKGEEVDEELPFRLIFFWLLGEGGRLLASFAPSRPSPPP